jgi:DNA (cytosine-5)-methyltransferase 1
VNYYNDNDPKCCAWLKELMQDGLIPKGEVDQRSITEVRPEDLRGYHQCHFFCGVAGWPLALRLAAWPEDREVWTGPCPCQPFSVAGKGRGEADERHLWPAFSALIQKCRPAVVVGEQVASKLGRAWLTGVCSDLEGMGYAFGAADLCAAGIGAPHIRQRLYWVGNAHITGREARERVEGRGYSRSERVEESSSCGGLADCFKSGLEGHAGDGANRNGEVRETQKQDRPVGEGGDAPYWNGPCVWHPCRDGVRRRIPAEPALFPLAHGVPGRVGLLRGAGNAIIPQVAAEFVKAFIAGTKCE